VGPEGALVALAILLTVGGIPSIYYGDEQGFTGVKEPRAGGDDAVRPAFPDEPGQLASWGKDLYRAHQDLIGLRRRNPWLVTATTEAVTVENTRYTYRARSRDDAHHLDVSIDLRGAPAVRVQDAAGRTLWRG
jgi:cyclomaltodextrinase